MKWGAPSIRLGMRSPRKWVYTKSEECLYWHVRGLGGLKTESICLNSFFSLLRLPQVLHNKWLIQNDKLAELWFQSASSIYVIITLRLRLTCLWINHTLSRSPLIRHILSFTQPLPAERKWAADPPGCASVFDCFFSWGRQLGHDMTTKVQWCRQISVNPPTFPPVGDKDLSQRAKLDDSPNVHPGKIFSMHDMLAYCVYKLKLETRRVNFII